MSLRWQVVLILAFTILCSIEGRSVKPKIRTKPKDACPKDHYYDQESSRCKKIPCGGTVIHTDTRRRCSGKYLGIKVHPKYQQYYYICKPKSVVFVKCPENQIFNSSISHCVAARIPEKPAKDISSGCKKSGRFPAISNCSLFYICSSDGQKIVRQLMECPKNMVYNPNIKRCSCTHKCIPTEVNPDDYFDDYDTETFPQCKRPGRFRSPTDCSLYYTCSAKTNGIFYQTRYRCPAGTLYDIENEKCLSKHRVKCEYATIEDLIQEYDKTHRYNESDVSEESAEYLDKQTEATLLPLPTTPSIHSAELTTIAPTESSIDSEESEEILGKQFETTLPPLITMPSEHDVDSTTNTPTNQSKIDFNQYEGTEADYLSSSEYYPNLDDGEEYPEKVAVTALPTTTESAEDTTTSNPQTSSIETASPDPFNSSQQEPLIDVSAEVDDHTSTSEQIEETTLSTIERTKFPENKVDIETTTHVNSPELCGVSDSKNSKCVVVDEGSESTTLYPTKDESGENMETTSTTEYSLNVHDGSNSEVTTELSSLVAAEDLPTSTEKSTETPENQTIVEDIDIVSTKPLLPESLVIESSESISSIENITTEMDATTSSSLVELLTSESTISTEPPTTTTVTKKIVEVPLNISVDSSENPIVGIEFEENTTSAPEFTTNDSSQQIDDASTASPHVESNETRPTYTTISSEEIDLSTEQFSITTETAKIFETTSGPSIEEGKFFATDDVLADEQEIDIGSMKVFTTTTTTVPTEELHKITTTSPLEEEEEEEEEEADLDFSKGLDGSLTVSSETGVTEKPKVELTTEMPPTDIGKDTTDDEIEQTTSNPVESTESSVTDEHSKETEAAADADATFEIEATTSSPINQPKEVLNLESGSNEQQLRISTSMEETTPEPLQVEVTSFSTTQSSTEITIDSVPETTSTKVESTTSTLEPQDELSGEDPGITSEDFSDTSTPTYDVTSTSSTLATTIESISEITSENPKLVETIINKENSTMTTEVSTSTEILETTTIPFGSAEVETVAIIDGEVTKIVPEETAFMSTTPLSTTEKPQDASITTQHTFEIPSTVTSKPEEKPCEQEGGGKVSTLNLEDKSVETLNVHISKPMKLLLHFQPKFTCADCQKGNGPPVVIKEMGEEITKEMSKDPKAIYLSF